MRRVLLVVLLTALPLSVGACRSKPPHLPAVCTDGAAVAKALAHAPGMVLVGGSTKISTCVSRAHTDGEIQTVGAVYTRLGDDLARRLPDDERAATQLGFLIGAVRRGSSTTNGTHEELARRIEQTTGLDGGGNSPGFARGLEAGRHTG
jgi:hypothetical protein